jgi:hypothetical protein
MAIGRMAGPVKDATSKAHTCQTAHSNFKFDVPHLKFEFHSHTKSDKSPAAGSTKFQNLLFEVQFESK